MPSPVELTPNQAARWAGWLYLLFMLSLIASSTIYPPVFGDSPAQTLQNLEAHATRFRVAFLCELASTALFLLAAWALYVLLQPVQRHLALLFLLLNLGGVAIQVTGALHHFAVLPILTGPGSGELPPALRVALARGSARLGTHAFMTANVFYGLWLFPLGYLVRRSGFLPRILGTVLIVDGCAVLTWVIQFFLWPGHGGIQVLLYPVMFLAEAGFALWLVARGVRQDPRP